MATGVDGGSALVPEVVWLSSASMRVVGGFIMSMSIPGIDICAFGFMPCMFGMGCFVWAQVESVTDKTSGSRIVAGLWSMEFLLLKTALWAAARKTLRDA
jgi:hypothetical protein